MTRQYEHHEMTDSPEYNSWRQMKHRCLNGNNQKYHLYGGAGIKIHEDWINSFSSFLAYMGDRPKGTTLDRIDSLGNYEPGNVRWATTKEQNNNTVRNVRVEFHGKTFTLAEFAEEVNLPYHFVAYHHYQNRTPEEISVLEQNGKNEVHVIKEYPDGSVELYSSILQASKMTGIPQTTIRRQLDQMYHGQCWRVYGDKSDRIQDGQKKFVVFENEWLSLSELGRRIGVSVQVVQKFYRKGITNGVDILEAITSSTGRKNSGSRSKVCRRVNGEEMVYESVRLASQHTGVSESKIHYMSRTGANGGEWSKV